MVMTNNDIVRDWAAAKNPAAQIVVLAELNAAKPDEIKKILRKGGTRVVANAYAQGAGLEKLAKRFGFSPMTIRAMIIEAGGTIRDRESGFEEYKRAEGIAPSGVGQAEKCCSQDEELPEKYNLDAYQLTKVLAQIAAEVCGGFDVEFTRIGEAINIKVCGNDESVTYFKAISKEASEN